MSLCPELGEKVTIPYEEIGVSNRLIYKKKLLEYMKQDILLLGGIMQKELRHTMLTYNIKPLSTFSDQSVLFDVKR